ncbi:MAG: zinc-ribbon domain-containing protein [Candidatus Bathyarchaeota archaeon]
MFCTNCGREIPDGAVFCPYCGASTSGASPVTSKGLKFSALDVLGASLNIIKKKPIVLLPQILSTAILIAAFSLSPGPSVFQTFESLVASATSFMSIMAIIVAGFIVSFIIEGMYPLMTKNVIEGKEVDLSAAFMKAVGRLPSLIGAGILVGLIVFAGFVLFIVPGIIFLIWYYYTVPAIMLENRGVLDAMSASKRFGGTRKWKTFLMILVLIVISIISSVFDFVPVVGWVIAAIIGFVVSVWGSIIPAYAYIKYVMPAQTTDV